MPGIRRQPDESVLHNAPVRRSKLDDSKEHLVDRGMLKREAAARRQVVSIKFWPTSHDPPSLGIFVESQEESVPVPCQGQDHKPKVFSSSIT